MEQTNKMKDRRFARQKILDQGKICKTAIKVKTESKSWISYFINIYSKCMGFAETDLVESEAKEIFTLRSALSASQDLKRCGKIIFPKSLLIYANQCCGALIPKNALKGDQLENLEDLQQEYTYPGPIPSAIISAIAIDEIRKEVSPIDRDIPLTSHVFYSMFSNNKFTVADEINNCANVNNYNITLMLYFKASIIGAGGIGTYAALLLSIEGAELTIYDPDIIEEHNLNRQFLYENCIGCSKAKVLAEKLEKITGNKANPITERFTHLNLETDILLSCVDNWRSRKAIFSEALKYNISVIDGAVHTFGGQLEVMPKERRDMFKEKINDMSWLVKEEYRPFGCSNIRNSNIVTNNGLIGSLMAAEAISILNGYPIIKKFKYSSLNPDRKKLVQIK